MTPETERQTAQQLTRLGRPEAALILGTGLGVVEEALSVVMS